MKYGPEVKIFYFGASLINFFNYFAWLRITDDGSVPEMCISSILLNPIKNGRSLFL